MTWETVIGLEVHTQLNTQSKLFSGSKVAFGASPNADASVIDLALPGTLPVFNQEALHLAIRFGLGVHGRVSPVSSFERKNYFYPDLPKGYQISQLDQPIVVGGFIDIQPEGKPEKRIHLTRAHLEEDAGKSLHGELQGQTGLDYNRAGTPLLEIVSEPELRSAEEAVLYLKSLHQLVRYLNISDGNMEEGSFRCDVNLSMRRLGDETLGTRTELKNLNSFRFIEQAILYERDRQIDCLESGQVIRQETRLYNPDKNITQAMRSKEEANDYRYFPDPDLLPVLAPESLIDQIQQTLPELPEIKKQRYLDQFKLSQGIAQQLLRDLSLADYFEQTLAAMVKPDPQLLANWLMGEWMGLLNREHVTVESCTITPAAMSELLAAIQEGVISNTVARDVQQALLHAPEKTPGDIIKEQGLQQISDEGELVPLIDDIIQQHPQQVADYRNGKDKLFAFFVGQVMKATRGQANPATVNQLLKERLSK